MADTRLMASPRDELRLMAGFFVMPLVSGLVAFLGFPLVWYSGRGLLPPGDLVDPMGAAVAFGLAVGILAVVVTAFGAVPVVLWVRRRWALSLPNVLVLGIALANAPFVLIVLASVGIHLVDGTLSLGVSHLWYGPAGAVRSVAIGTVIGVVSALVFWVVAVRWTLAGR